MTSPPPSGAAQHAQAQDTIRRHHRDALIARLPARGQRMAAWLLAEEHKIPRMAAGSLLIVGGVFSFLPVLGLWMLPLGLLLLAEDIPLLRGLCTRLLVWAAQKRPDLFTLPAKEAPPAPKG